MTITLKQRQKDAESQNDSENRKLAAQSQATATLCNAIGSGIASSFAQAAASGGILSRPSKATVDNAMLSAAKNIGQLPPAAHNPELQNLMRTIGVPGTRVVGHNGAVVDAVMTRSTKGHRAGNNRIRDNVSDVSSNSGLAAIRRASGGQGQAFSTGHDLGATLHQPPFSVSPPPYASYANKTTPKAALTNNANWESPAPPDVDVDAMARNEAMLQEQHHLLSSFHPGAKVPGSLSRPPVEGPPHENEVIVGE